MQLLKIEQLPQLGITKIYYFSLIKKPGEQLNYLRYLHLHFNFVYLHELYILFDA